MFRNIVIVMLMLVAVTGGAVVYAATCDSIPGGTNGPGGTCKDGNNCPSGSLTGRYVGSSVVTATCPQCGTKSCCCVDLYNADLPNGGTCDAWKSHFLHKDACSKDRPLIDCDPADPTCDATMETVDVDGPPEHGCTE